LYETEDGVSIQIENLGYPIDALISVADGQDTIIGDPYHVKFSNWSNPRSASFRLLRRDEKLHLIIQSARGESYRIPLFIRQQIRTPQIFAFPMEQSAKVGESAEYSIFVEGDGNDRGRYPIAVEGLPSGVAWQIAKIVPAPPHPDTGNLTRSISVGRISFTSAFNRHELRLELTLGRDVPKVYLGRPIPFILKIGRVKESLSITPVGVGELTVDLPALVSARVGEMLKIPISLRNVGTELVSDIDIRAAGTTYGVSVSAAVSNPIGANEQREVALQLTLSPDVSEGEREIKLVLASSAGSQTVAFRLDIQPRPMTVARLTPPILVILAIVLAIYVGMKAQTWRVQRKRERAHSYAVSEGGDQ
jgi:hypothetical protein